MEETIVDTRVHDEKSAQDGMRTGRLCFKLRTLLKTQNLKSF